MSFFGRLLLIPAIITAFSLGAGINLALAYSRNPADSGADQFFSSVSLTTDQADLEGSCSNGQTVSYEYQEGGTEIFYDCGSSELYENLPSDLGCEQNPLDTTEGSYVRRILILCDGTPIGTKEGSGGGGILFNWLQVTPEGTIVGEVIEGGETTFSLLVTAFFLFATSVLAPLAALVALGFVIWGIGRVLSKFRAIRK